MADKTFERPIINPRERPLSSDVNLASSVLDRALRDYLLLLGQTPFNASSTFGVPRNAFVADSFKVSAPGGMIARIKAGIGFQYLASDAQTDIDGVVGLDDASLYKPLFLSAVQDITIPAADPTNGRYDIIEVKCDRRRENSLTRDIFNPATEVYDPTLVMKSLAFDLYGRTGFNDTTAGINYKVGTPAGSPTVPAVDSGYVQIATIFVAAAAVSINESRLIDKRATHAPNGQVRFAVTFTCSPDPAGAIAAPVVTQSVNIPGWNFAVTCRDNGTCHAYRLLLLPAGGVSGVVPTVSLKGSSFGLSTTFAACNVDVQTGTLGAGDVIVLAGGDATQIPSHTFLTALGAHVIAVDMVPLQQSGGSSTQTGMASATVHLSLDIQV